MELTKSQVMKTLKLSKISRHRERTRVGTWRRRGFLPEERYYMSEMSRSGTASPAIQGMIKQRVMRLLSNKARYGWTQRQYRLHVVAEYERCGIRARRKRESIRHYILKTYYDYFEYFKKTEPGGMDYDYLEERKMKLLKSDKVKHPTMRKQLKRNIEDWNRKILGAMQRGDQEERKRLERERNNYQRRLDRLG